MQRIHKNSNKYCIIIIFKKIYLLFNYLYSILLIIFVINIIYFKNIFLHIKNSSIVNNNCFNIKNNNIFLTNINYSFYLKKNNKFKKKIIFNYNNSIINNLFFNRNNVFKFNNKKMFFLVNYIQIKNNFFIDALNFGLKINDINHIIKIISKFINLKKINKNDKFIIFNLYNSYKPNFNINNLIYIKIMTKKNNIYIYKYKNKYYKFNNLNIKNNKFMKFPTNKKFKITSKFNLNRLNPITSKIIPHKGIDIAMPIGTPILSISNGIIKENSINSNAGNYIVIKHSNGCITKYMHLKKSIVKKGEIVNLGQCIGYSGNSGRSTGPHLHFEIWINYKAVNPLTIKLDNNLFINDIFKFIYSIELNISNFINN